MNYIFLYILIMIFAVALKNFSKLKIGRNINLSIILMVFIFLLGFSHNIYITRKAFFVIFILACLYIAYRFIKNKQYFSELKEYILNPSFYFFTIIYIVFAIVLYSSELTGIDDTFFWSQFVRNAFKLGTLFPKTGYLNVTYDTYPPLLPAYLTMMSCLLGGYSDSFLLFGNAIFCVSFITSIFDDVVTKNKSVLSIFLSSITYIIVLFTINWSPNLFHNTYLFNSVYADWPVAIVFAYTFFRSIHKIDTLQEWIYFVLSLIVLSMIKQVGAPLAFLCLITQLLLRFYLSDFKKKKEATIIVLFIFLLLALIPSIQNSIYLQLFKFIGEKIASSISHPDRLLILNTFIDAVFKCDIVMHPFSISYIYLVLIFTIIIAVIGYIKKSLAYKLGSIMYLVGAIGYAIVICLFYVFVMGSGESTTMVQFSRYMQVYTFAGIIIVVSLLLDTITTKAIIIALVFSCLFFDPKSFVALSRENLISIYHDPIEEIKKYVENEYNYERILVLNQNDAAITAKIRSAFGLKGQNVRYTSYDENTSYEDFKDLVSKYDYLLVGSHNDLFYETFWIKTSDTALANFALYRIGNSDGELEFYFAHSFIEEAKRNKDNNTGNND